MGIHLPSFAFYIITADGNAFPYVENLAFYLFNLAQNKIVIVLSPEQ